MGGGQKQVLFSSFPKAPAVSYMMPFPPMMLSKKEKASTFWATS